jgi:hypothetical protein
LGQTPAHPNRDHDKYQNAEADGGGAAAVAAPTITLASLTEGVLKAMLPTKLQSAMLLLLMGFVLSGGAFSRAGLARATGQSPAQQKEAPKSGAKESSKWPGEWLFEAKGDQPCAIFQHGRVLLLVNEDGEMATGRITEATKLVVLKGSWEEGLVGELVDEGKTISWGNGTKWNRP